MAVDFGKDVSCTTTLKPGRFATGVRLVAEAAYRRLITPRGMLSGGEEEADYGIDLAGLIGTTSAKSDAVSLPGRIRNELLKDERIERVTVDIAVTVNGPATSFAITVDCVTTAGPFTLRLNADDVTVALLGIETEEAT